MPRKIVIDTDPGVDDVLAILLALASPEIEVSLITPVFGNTHAPQTFANLLKLYYNLGLEVEANPAARERYASLGRNKTVVAVGEDGPIGGQKHVATYFHGRDGLSNITETHPEFNLPEGLDTLAPGQDHPYLEVSPKGAPDAILDLLRAEPEGSVTIVALGPLTNVAWAQRKDPQTFARVREVVWMGGALDVPGNTSPVAEFNCFADPYALAELIDNVKGGTQPAAHAPEAPRFPFRFTFAPLDITTPHTVGFTDLLYPGLVPGNDPAAYPPPTHLQAFTTAFLLRVRWLQEKFGHADAMEMHDPLAVWYAIEHATGPNDQWTTTPRDFGVERSGEITRGMCVVDRRGTGESTQDRTQDKELTTGNAHLGAGANGTGKNKAVEAAKEANPVPVAAVPADKAEEEIPAGCNCAAIPYISPAQCPHRPAYLPRMITRTPGSEALRRTLLLRVFGTQV